MRNRAPVCYFEPVEGRGDAAIISLAGRQHGHVSRDQLTSAGLGRHAIAHRLATGWLTEVHPCVYRLGGAAEHEHGKKMAAALLFRGHALIAGKAAASLWEILDTTQKPDAKAPIDVLLVGKSAKPRPGVTVHRIASITRKDIRRRAGIPLTSPARTLLDLAAATTMDDLDLEAALTAAFSRSLVRRSQLEDVMARNPRAKGIKRLRTLLEQTESLHDTRSIYERKLLALLRKARLPIPLTNVVVAGEMVDGLWPDLKLVYEVDGWRYHRGKFESDRLRDQHMLASGHRVFRITRRQIDYEPYALVARVSSVLTTVRLTLQPAGPLA